MKILSWIFGHDASVAQPPKAVEPEPMWRVVFFSADDVECSFCVRAAGPMLALEKVKLLATRGRSPLKDLRHVEAVGLYEEKMIKGVSIKFYTTHPQRGMMQTRMEGFGSPEEAIDAALKLQPEARVVALGGT